MHMNPIMPTDTFCSDTLYVNTDPGSLPSFAEECSFGNLSSDSYHSEKAQCCTVKLCSVWDAHMGSVLPLTTTAVSFYYNLVSDSEAGRITLPVGAPDLRNSQVASSMLTFRCAAKEFFSQSNMLS